MISDFLFPGILLAMKFCFRVAVHREFNRVEFCRTGLLFPIDMIFLAFTFCAAVLVNLQRNDDHQIADIKLLFAIFCGLVTATILTIILARDAEKEFGLGKNLSCLVKFCISLAVSTTSLIGSTILVRSI